MVVEKLTKQAIEHRIKYLRRGRLANKSYYVRKADQRPAELYDFSEFVKPYKPVTLPIKLACDLCQEHHPEHPELYTKTIAIKETELYRLWHFGGRIIAGAVKRSTSENDLVHNFQQAGLAAEVKYYCPTCVKNGIVLAGKINHEKLATYGQERGIFVLSLKTIDGYSMDSILDVLFTSDDIPTVSLQDCQLALRLLANNKPHYVDFNKLFQTGHDEAERVGLIKLKLDCALQKVFGVKIEYDKREMLKSFLALHKAGQPDAMKLLSGVETTMLNSENNS